MKVVCPNLLSKWCQKNTICNQDKFPKAYIWCFVFSPSDPTSFPLPPPLPPSLSLVKLILKILFSWNAISTISWWTNWFTDWWYTQLKDFKKPFGNSAQKTARKAMQLEKTCKGCNNVFPVKQLTFYLLRFFKISTIFIFPMKTFEFLHMMAYISTNYWCLHFQVIIWSKRYKTQKNMISILWSCLQAWKYNLNWSGSEDTNVLLAYSTCHTSTKIFASFKALIHHYMHLGTVSEYKEINISSDQKISSQKQLEFFLLRIYNSDKI